MGEEIFQGIEPGLHKYKHKLFNSFNFLSWESNFAPGYFV